MCMFKLFLDYCYRQNYQSNLNLKKKGSPQLLRSWLLLISVVPDKHFHWFRKLYISMMLVWQTLFILHQTVFEIVWTASRWPISNGSTTWWVTMVSTRGRSFWYQSVIRKFWLVAHATLRWITMQGTMILQMLLVIFSFVAGCGLYCFITSCCLLFICIIYVWPD